MTGIASKCFPLSNSIVSHFLFQIFFFDMYFDSHSQMPSKKNIVVCSNILA